MILWKKYGSYEMQIAFKDFNEDKQTINEYTHFLVQKELH
ncbi:hypothetical protein ACUXQF_002540 [Staphylococcus epidermidis]